MVYFRQVDIVELGGRWGYWREDNYENTCENTYAHTCLHHVAAHACICVCVYMHTHIHIYLRSQVEVQSMVVLGERWEQLEQWEQWGSISRDRTRSFENHDVFSGSWELSASISPSLSLSISPSLNLSICHLLRVIRILHSSSPESARWLWSPESNVFLRQKNHRWSH
jgi:hypothetical protein